MENDLRRLINEFLEQTREDRTEEKLNISSIIFQHYDQQ